VRQVSWKFLRVLFQATFWFSLPNVSAPITKFKYDKERDSPVSDYAVKNIPEFFVPAAKNEVERSGE